MNALTVAQVCAASKPGILAKGNSPQRAERVYIEAAGRKALHSRRPG